ncbi:MAG TPA: hypothetical protein VN714_06025 [Trebonia sp.]|jgi:hypothetical protein|nr:hypothetical protein [Trebonia sp.]
MFTETPELATELAASLNGNPLPAGTPAHPQTSPDGNSPADADAVIVAGPAKDPVRAIIVIAQKRTYRDRPPRWAHQAAELWTRLRCPVDVLVICPDAKSAYFYAQPIPTTLPGYVLVPIVVPPSAVPAITNPDEAAANPAMAALSVAYHGTDPAIPEAVAAGFRQLPPDSAARYRDRAYNIAPLAVQRTLQQLNWRNPS